MFVNFLISNIVYLSFLDLAMSLRDELVVLLDVSFKALSESGSIPLLILLVNEQSAPLTLLFRIRCLNLHKRFSIFI